MEACNRDTNSTCIAMSNNFRLILFSSDEELSIERVNSAKATPKFTVVPKDTKYIFKFKDKAGKAYSLVEYNLREGKKLPYNTVIKGLFGCY